MGRIHQALTYAPPPFEWRQENIIDLCHWFLQKVTTVFLGINAMLKIMEKLNGK